MSQYARGRRYEQKVVRAMKALGAQVTRSAGSKGLWDVTVLFPEGVVWLIQVKYSKDGKGWKDGNWRQLAKAHRVDGVYACAFVFHRRKPFPKFFEVGGNTVPPRPLAGLTPP